ncbi:hypothetical protein [Salinibacter ruber]|jgi:hypothetical protein|uniref:hypothetical protein n=1 Tax=Salinibacter ruber TaxID=146919 RepID=UPI002072C779|nr:hypothetical protein [Salinibacter ruber]MCS4198188.1 hypothetical protein [Salinibacter ruber]
MNSTTNPDALQGFTDGVAKRVTGDLDPFLIFGPRWVQEGEGAGPPPESLSDPVWSQETGWTEKSAATEKFDGEPLILNAPKDDGTGQ